MMQGKGSRAIDSRAFRLFGVLIVSVGLSVVGLTGCGKKSTDGMGPGTEITGETETQDPGGTGSTLPVADEKIPGDEQVTIQDIFFDYDRYELRSEANRVLQENARFLMNNSSARVVLEGHCDERGTNEYNLALGQRRADAVLQYLVELGISATRMSTVSYGEEKPFAFGSTESAWAENRRVHFILR